MTTTQLTDAVPTDISRRARDLVVPVAAIGVALLGLAASTLAANTALAMGEIPVTLLPGGRWLAARGLPALVASRLAVVLLAYGLAARLAPRYRLHALAATGLCWLLWAGWQFWVLLALT
ncbi:hypothetical protein [Haloglomus litoreum]|uniref:hypothetical protein n=1 Tax=Haloglomus litoreum TaxID=3034026 RepID=UPI0023E8BC10|nr:hypothetical protein [Haloglomus sp. DT116]